MKHVTTAKCFYYLNSLNKIKIDNDQKEFNFINYNPRKFEGYIIIENLYDYKIYPDDTIFKVSFPETAQIYVDEKRLIVDNINIISKPFNILLYLPIVLKDYLIYNFNNVKHLINHIDQLWLVYYFDYKTDIIKYVYNPSHELIIKSITYDPYNIVFVKNKTKNIIDIAVSLEPDIINFI